MKAILLISVILLFAASSGAQTHFYLEEPFKRPAKIPNSLIPLLREEMKSTCSGDMPFREPMFAHCSRQRESLSIPVGLLSL